MAILPPFYTFFGVLIALFFPATFVFSHTSLAAPGEEAPIMALDSAQIPEVLRVTSGVR